MNHILRFGLLFGILTIVSCANQKEETRESGIFVIKDSNTTGITFSNDLLESQALNIVEYLYYYNGGGVAIGDINNDGLEDVYFTGNEVPDRLYLNKGNLQFEDITEKAGISEQSGWSSGVSIDDINGDGNLDIYICKVSPLSPDGSVHNLLYINDGNGNFTEQSAALGLDFKGYSTQSCFLDYDKDGDLDMYLLNHTVHSVRSYGDIKKRQQKDALSGDRFFENRIREEGRFVEVTEDAGIYSSPLGYGLAIAAGDLNGDGWTDIYVGNDFHENDYLYLNNGDKTFSESIASAFTNTSQFSMGVDIADLNNDGANDVFSTDMMPYEAEVVLKSGGEDSDEVKRIKKDLGFELQNARNHLQLNNGSGTFTDISFFSRTFATDWSWAVLLQDFNNDLLTDIFITNGIVKRPNDLDYINYLNYSGGEATSEELIGQMPSQPLSNILFLNRGDWTYSDIHSSLVGPPSFSSGAAYADLDLDGDLDLVTNNINQEAFVMENQSSAQNNYLRIRLQGGEALPVVKGSRVTIFADGTSVARELQTTRGYQSSSTHLLHFGLKDVQAIDSVRIVWPDGTTQMMNDVTANQELTITYQPGQRMADFNSVEAGNKSMQARVFSLKHEDNNYYDEDREKLVPERLSYAGPALLCEDLTGDGITDVYLGGGRNQRAMLMIGKPDGSFETVNSPDFDRDARYEDIDAATIDFDRDGDLDLYVVSGGNDNKELNKLLEDRLYLNNGNGDFRRIPISLPHTNGSCIAISDFDKDGFEDMFIGASTIPGSYGLSPYSFVLKNRDGQGVEIAHKERYGMVKDGEWIDYDNDGDDDLFICGDWMKIRVYRNDLDTLIEVTNDIGFEKSYGFWNTLEFTDLNGDGRPDILAGNAGTNQKWTASEDRPIKLYVGDYDANGYSDPVIFYTYFDRYLPFASLDKLTSQLPVLKKKFLSYNDYRQVEDIDDLFADAGNKTVEYKVVYELRSMVYLSEGDSYTGHALGNREQLSSINDFVVLPEGGICYIGNDYEYVAELGPSLSNTGGVLSDFNPVEKSFRSSRPLALPAEVSGRRIGIVAGNKLLVATNDNYPYIISLSRDAQ